ncbi:hypothetical protein IPM44_03495 [bacterium]|nr:MAG: hypothetical protein IPM44_03495 [bacterium]
MRKKWKYMLLTTAGALALMGISAIAGAIGSGMAGYGMPYRQPESSQK